jgi:hypothetical protein
MNQFLDISVFVLEAEDAEIWVKVDFWISLYMVKILEKMVPKSQNFEVFMTKIEYLPEWCCKKN